MVSRWFSIQAYQVTIPQSDQLQPLTLPKFNSKSREKWWDWKTIRLPVKEPGNFSGANWLAWLFVSVSGQRLSDSPWLLLLQIPMNISLLMHEIHTLPDVNEQFWESKRKVSLFKKHLQLPKVFVLDYHIFHKNTQKKSSNNDTP